MSHPEVPNLKSYVEGRWIAGQGKSQELMNPTNGEVIARCSSEGLDFYSALAFARSRGGPALRALTFPQRAALLTKIVDALASRRDRWFEIARMNSGNTKADAVIDIDGAIGTIKYYAKLGERMGESKILIDERPVQLTRDPNFQAAHIGIPIKGAAVHINAYNFPAWGLWEKASVSLLAGTPIVAKPATSTSWLAQEMVQCVVEAGILPEGALSLICGPVHDLLDHLEFGDAVSFTGSADTGRTIRSHPAILTRGVRVNIEADSLNAAILGPDSSAGSPAFDFFIREVVKEMTIKAGQKCTAIRRVLAPANQAASVLEAITAQLEQIAVGDPANANVGMGPLVNMSQRIAVEEGIRQLSSASKMAYPAGPSKLLNADTAAGAFVAPTLLYAESSGASNASNEIEVFGPVATLIPYRDAQDAFSIAERGGGSLAASVFSADPAFLQEAAIALGPSHGRILLVDPSIGNSHTGHGIVMPSCIHGGPGRAGGGEELGALRGLWFYHQRVAVQGAAGTLSGLT